MTIRATTLATEELRKVYEAGGPIHGLHSRADIGVLLSRRLQKRRQLSDEDPTTVRAALADKIREASVNTVAEVFSRAYQSEIRRAQAASRLGAFSAEDWALRKAQDILAAPSAVAASITTRLGRLAARAKHVAKAVAEPLDEQTPVVHPEPLDE